MENVIVIGASSNEERYSNKAMKMLEEHGHNPIPSAPTEGEILDRKIVTDITQVQEKIDTVTMYVGPQRQDEKLFQQIISLNPKRVIFNPGTENPQAYEILQKANIKTVEACTLVLLRTGQY